MPSDEDNVIAALEHPDRVRGVCLDVMSSQLGKVAMAMQDPFPVLKRLEMRSVAGVNTHKSLSRAETLYVTYCTSPQSAGTRESRSRYFLKAA